MKLDIRTRLRREGFELNVDTTLPIEGVTALFGRSGCGKTTLLRVIAGLEQAHGAEVIFGDAVWQRGRHFTPLHKRGIGLVFQEHSLLPHLDVRGNLLYGYRRTPAGRRRLELTQVTDMLGIGGLLDRQVDRLSGGQRQRVSLGRALLTSPQLLLLDEPMAALDTQTKREIMPFLSRLASDSGIPIVMVSHVPEEVQRLADRVAFMRDGRIERVETLHESLARPDSPLFDDEGAASVLEATPGPLDRNGLRAFGPESVRFWIHTDQSGNDDRPKRLRIQARDVSLALEAPSRISIQNRLRVTIERIEPPHRQRVLVATRLDDGQLLMSEITPWAAQDLGLQPGQTVYALIKSVALME